MIYCMQRACCFVRQIKNSPNLIPAKFSTPQISIPSPSQENSPSSSPTKNDLQGSQGEEGYYGCSEEKERQCHQTQQARLCQDSP